MNYHKGIDVLFSDPEKPLERPECLACGSVLRMTREDTARSFAEAMSKHKTDSLVYSCPYTGGEDHDHLVELYREWEGLKSDRLRKIVRDEIEEKRKKLIKSKKG